MIPVALVMLLTSVPPVAGYIDGQPIRPCLRSGMCCLKATCAVGVGHGADPEGRCKFLRGDSAGSYSCGLVDDGTVSKDTIHAGAGCCSPLGNTARDEVLQALLSTQKDGYKRTAKSASE